MPLTCQGSQIVLKRLKLFRKIDLRFAMALSHELERVGNWFFRWRSYLTLAPVGVISSGSERFYLSYFPENY